MKYSLETGDVLTIENLNVSYNKYKVLDNISLSIKEGKITGIVGPNGAGKSSLIKAIMGLIKIDKGQIKIFNDNLKNIRNKVSYVPQRESVDWDFPVSVFDTVLMGRYGKLGLFKRPKKKDKEIAFQCLEKMGMADYHERQIGELSGGQKQRVFLARSLAQDADLYLMDEPFAGVDATTQKAIINMMKEMRNQGKSIVVVHHDLHTVQDYFDCLVLLNYRLINYGPVEDIFSNKNIEDTYEGTIHKTTQIPAYF